MSTEDTRSPDDTSPGWNAIDRALRPIYGDQQPRHYGTLIKYRLGGPDPLDGVSAYPRDTPIPHWHFITYGLSELYAKETDDPEFSGYGFELTFRLARSPGEAEPPVWALNFLQNLARYVFGSGNVFAPGHHMALNGPIAVERPDTAIRAVLFAADPELGQIQTPHGALAFVQVLGVTEDERRAAMAWNPTGFLDLLAAHLPLLTTDLDRPSALDRPEVAAQAREGARRDGSSTGSVYLDVLEWRTGRPGGATDPARGQPAAADADVAEITLGAIAVPDLCAILPARVAHDRPFSLRGPQQWVRFERADTPDWTAAENGLVARLPAAAASALAEQLAPRAGVYPVPGFERLAVRIVPTTVRDPDGNITQTIG